MEEEEDDDKDKEHKGVVRRTVKTTMHNEQRQTGVRNHAIPPPPKYTTLRLLFSD